MEILLNNEFIRGLPYKGSNTGGNRYYKLPFKLSKEDTEFNSLVINSNSDVLLVDMDNIEHKLNVNEDTEHFIIEGRGMTLIFEDEFIEDYRMAELSRYNYNYYRLPIQIRIDNNTYDILNIECDENYNEYSYKIMKSESDLEMFIEPSGFSYDNDSAYELNLDSCNESMIWF